MESERKQQIIAEAERLFSERGYHATSMRDLARALDLQGGSLYSHIESKEELLWLIVDGAASEFLSTLRPSATSEASPEEKLREAIRGHMRVITSNLDAATVYFHEWRFLSPPRRAAFLRRRREYEALFRELVEETVAETPNVDPKWATLLILSATNWLYQWYDPEGELSADELAERFTGMLFGGLLLPAVA